MELGAALRSNRSLNQATRRSASHRGLHRMDTLQTNVNSELRVALSDLAAQRRAEREANCLNRQGEGNAFQGTKNAADHIDGT